MAQVDFGGYPGTGTMDDWWQTGGQPPWSDFPQPGGSTPTQTGAPPAAAPTTPAAPTSNPWEAYAQHPFYQSINKAYQRYFGRTPGGSEIWDRLGQGKGLTEDNLNRQLYDIAHSFSASDFRDRGEGFVPPAGGATGGAGPFDVNAFGQGWTGSGGRTLQDWLNYYNSHPEAGQAGAKLTGSKQDKLEYAGRIYDMVIASGLGGQGASFNDVSGGAPVSSYMAAYAPPVAAQFNDPSTNRLEEYVNSLIAQLQQPPFTGPEQEVLRTQALEPIERDRSAAKQRALNNIGSRGFDPSSGIAQELLNLTDSTFDRQRATAQNQLAYNTIGQQRANQQQVLNLLGLLYQLPRNSMNDALSVLGYQPNYGSLFNSYAQLGSMNAMNSANSGQWLGSLLAYLLR